MTAADRMALRLALLAAADHVRRLAINNHPGLSLIDRRGIAGDHPKHARKPRGG